MSETVEAPPCPKCGKPMYVAFVVPRVAGHAEIVSFRCRACGQVLTKTDEKPQSDQL